MLINCADESEMTYRAFVLIKQHRNTKKVPDDALRSPWFMPSIGQWFDMLVNICGWSTENGLNDKIQGRETLNKIKIQLSKIDNVLPDFGETSHRLGFNCSSQYDKDRSWMLIWHMDDPEYNWERICLQGYYKSSVWNVRPFFAF